jgi:hypothetical protein
MPALGISALLPFTRFRHPLCHGGRIFGQRWQCQILRTHAGDVDMNVDAVEQRSRETTLIIHAAFGRAAAGLRHIREVAAAAGIHRSDKLEASGITYMRVRPRDDRLARFHRLPERIQNRPLEFRY